MGLVAIVGILLGIRRDAGSNVAVASLSERLGVVRQPTVLGLLGVTLFWSVGAFVAYPYIAPYLAEVLGFGPTGISVSVSAWGLAAAVGVTVGGSLNDRLGSRRVVVGSLVVLGLSFLTLALATRLAPALARVPVLAGVVGWGFSVWSFYPAQLARLIGAGPAAQAPVALALNTSTMYLGFSLGSAIGATAAASEIIALVLDRHRASVS